MKLVNTNNKHNFGIYIHWPFCLSKCPYCDFFSKVKKDVPQDEIIADYLNDLDFYAEITNNRQISSIFFGGGTPSLIQPQNLEKILNHIAKKWAVSKDIEISLEANPNTQTPSLFADLKSTGINRLSLGIQALNDDDLKFLGRTHNYQSALQAIEQVLQNFSNHSMDLIYARPQQNLNNWEKELQQAIAFGFKHLSLYQLTIEEGTIFHKKDVQPMEDDIALEMYDTTNKLLSSHGYNQYEVSNYAQDGFASHHNQLYWHGDDYLGIGQAAHGRLHLNGKFYATTHQRQMEELTAEERAEELIIMGLRMTSGINKKHFQTCCGLDFDNFINQANLQKLIANNLVINNSDSLRANSFALLNKIIEELCL